MSSSEASDREDSYEDMKREIGRLKRKLKDRKRSKRRRYSRERSEKSRKRDARHFDCDDRSVAYEDEESSFDGNEQPGDDLVIADRNTEEEGVTANNSSLKNGSNQDVEPNKENIQELDQEILRVLGTVDATKSWADPIQKDVALLWEDLAKRGLSEDALTTLNKKYEIPENCRILEPPTLNKEVKASLPEIAISSDKRLISKQQSLAVAISALGKAITTLCKNTSDENLQLVELINDAARCITHCHHTETLTRKSIISKKVNPTLSGALVNSQTDEFLFGSKFDEYIKSAKALNRTTQELKTRGVLKLKNDQKQTPTSSNQAKNFKGPSRHWVRQVGQKTSQRTLPRTQHEKKREEYRNFSRPKRYH